LERVGDDAVGVGLEAVIRELPVLAELAVEGGNDNIRRQIASSVNCLLPVNKEYLCRPSKPVRYILPEPRRGDGNNPVE